MVTGIACSNAAILPQRTKVGGACPARSADRAGQAPPTLVLWGKIAALLQAMPVTTQFPQAVAEHPYNLSFIKNKDMQQLFGPMRLLAAKNLQ